MITLSFEDGIMTNIIVVMVLLHSKKLWCNFFDKNVIRYQSLSVILPSKGMLLWKLEIARHLQEQVCAR